ncbi:PREDICTED: uncharacterized protein LOC109187952 isoform X2 [Ipomoea nil]|uniref:uncharacterized protein LOC109187952 isoform X2 n=1 Tax=Ipomoea nil TaxID=35883 RepID=UPI000901377C|nr:PREDICTED: uncharacterized protein LOC109187952 isoform X2 [Ipomoea nil]
MEPENNTVTQPNFPVSKEDHPFCLVERFLPRQHPTFTPLIRQAESHYQWLKHQRTQTSNELQQKKIRKLHSKLQHGSNKRAEEKNLFEEIKNAELRRQDLIAAANKTPQASSREERVQNIVQEIEQLKTEDMAFRTQLQQYRRDLMATEKDIRRLEKKLTDLNVKKAQVFHRILQLKQYQFQSSVIFRHLVNCQKV